MTTKRPSRSLATCRTIIDALGLSIAPEEVAQYVLRANRAYALGDMDSYHTQCDFIRMDAQKKTEVQQ